MTIEEFSNEYVNALSKSNPRILIMYRAEGNYVSSVYACTIDSIEKRCIWDDETDLIVFYNGDAISFYIDPNNIDFRISKDCQDNNIILMQNYSDNHHYILIKDKVKAISMLRGLIKKEYSNSVTSLTKRYVLRKFQNAKTKIATS